jgi:hypothetical protein
MVPTKMQVMAVAVCLLGVLGSDRAALNDPVSDSQSTVDDSNPIDGLWSGSWGGGERGGVVFQPVMAELLINGDHVELTGFRNVSKLTGTVRFDARIKRMRLTAPAKAGTQPAPKSIEYAYEIKGDELTLIDSDNVTISLQRVRVAKDPILNAQVEFVAAAKINDTGDLLVTEFGVLRAGEAGTTYFRPESKVLNTKRATVFLIQDTGLKRITIDGARGLIRESTPVVVAYRHDDRPPPRQWHELWKEMGPPTPDSDAVGPTLSRMLRPGTLVFVLSSRENVPRP